jgi:hypothetical protein
LSDRTLRLAAASVAALGVREELVHVETWDLLGALANEVVRHPAVVLAALVPVERFLELPESILQAGREDESQCLHRVRAEEGEAAVLGRNLARLHVLVHHGREDVLRVEATRRTLRVGVFDQRHGHRLVAQHCPFLRDAGKVDRGRRRRWLGVPVPEQERDRDQCDGGSDGHGEREYDGASGRTLGLGESRGHTRSLPVLAALLSGKHAELPRLLRSRGYTLGYTPGSMVVPRSRE